MEEINFKGIVDLDAQTIQQLRVHLDEQEHTLFMHIAKLSQELSHQIHDTQISSVIQAAWAYLELIERMIHQFFAKLKQVDLEMWTSDLLQCAQTIHELFELKITKLRERWLLLEALVVEKMWPMWQKVLFFWRSPLDRSFSAAIRSSKKNLRTECQGFRARYGELVRIKEKSTPHLKKLDHYPILGSLGAHSREVFKKVYALLKLWEFNTKRGVSLTDELRNTFHHLCSIEHATRVFETYRHALREKLFELGREVKRDSDRETILSSLHACRVETHTLGAAINQYHEFFLRSHPDPYVRTRWGFSEGIVGQEPHAIHAIAQEMYQVEKIDRWMMSLEIAIKAPMKPDFEEAEALLHEMAQPLLTADAMRGRVHRWLVAMQKLNELGTFDSSVTEYVGRALVKAILYDWQYFVLFEISLFHELFELHQGVSAKDVRAEHLARMKKLQLCLECRADELPQIVEDLKEILSNDLTSQNILEYQYLIGSFFSKLMAQPYVIRSLPEHLLQVRTFFEAKGR